MSRSKKKTRIHGNTTAASEKEDKRKANRKLRRLVRERMRSRNEHLPRLREVSNVYSFNKDGKQFRREMDGKLMRK